MPTGSKVSIFVETLFFMYLIIYLLQGGSQQFPDGSRSAEEEQESAAFAPGHVWKHLGGPADSTVHARPAGALSSC